MSSYKSRPYPSDAYPTETSRLQHETESTLQFHLPSPNSNIPASPNIPVAGTLHKSAHVQFLVRNLLQGFPPRYTSQDASQPWLLFWTLHGFSLLQVGLDPDSKQRVIDTIMPCQHPDGGFGGGPGQAPHLLPTYAAVCTLAIVGRPGPNGGWDQVDREKMYALFMSLKQPDGSFQVSTHGEVDVRGIYCLLTSAYLLNLLTPALLAGTAAFLSACQTYEGGFASSAHPYFSPEADGPPTLLPAPRPPLGEAHGGYTFCALACWTMLKPLLPLPPPAPAAAAIDLPNLLRWLTHMQGSTADLGGFRGRTNKLVDGCYAWWIGGCFALLDALGLGGGGGETRTAAAAEQQEAVVEDDKDGDWADVDDTLFDRKALQEYVLYAGQSPAGGLRDKPPKTADSYHTLYCLAGLSVAQHNMRASPARRAEIRHAWTPIDADRRLDGLRKTAFAEGLCWKEEGTARPVGGAGNSVNATHPIFNLTNTHTEAIMSYFYGQTVPHESFRMKSS